MSTYKLDKAVSAKSSISLDERIENLVKQKKKIEKTGSKSLSFEPITKHDLEKINFSDDLVKLKAIQRERLMEDLSSLLNEKIKELEKKDKEVKQKEELLLELTDALHTKVEELKTANIKLNEEKKHSEELNQNLKATLKKLSEAEIQLKLERDWLAEQVEKKSIEVLKTIDELIKAENSHSLKS